MRKLILTFLVLIVLLITSFGQDSTLLMSVVVERVQDNTTVNESRTVYQYNEKNILIGNITQTFDENLQGWENANRVKIQKDLLERDSVLTIQGWDDSLWVNFFRTEQFFDSNTGKKIESFNYYYLNDSTSVFSNIYKYVYDQDGKILERRSYRDVDASLLTSILIYIYNDSESKVNLLYQQQSNGTLVDVYRTERLYESGSYSKLIQETKENWNIASGWRYDLQKSYQYENDVLVLVLNKEYIGLRWSTISKETYNYSVVTNVDNSFSKLPTNFKLHQNYPNPFNPTTTISYNIAKADNVRLSVYSVLGEEVAVLVDEFQNAGDYRVDFDSSTLNLNSGVYIYTLNTNGAIQTKKMVLLK